jgi:alpha-D-xyloside xylohydrolase
MRGALRAALSAALSGTAYWASDIGGFYGMAAIDPELYARWAWMGCLSAISRFHGMTPREPYAFAQDACNAAVLAARLRYALLPYLVAAMPRGKTTDLPLMRPLLLEWPDDALMHDEATEYLLGPDLLVAPVLTPGGRRSVHLPEGQWADWWTGRSVSGPVRLDVEVPLDRVPLYQRGGSVVPLGRGTRVEEVLAGPLTAKRSDEPWRPDHPAQPAAG